MTVASPETGWRPGADRDAAPDLSRNMGDARALRNTVLTVLLWTVAILASAPLFSVLYMLVVRGGRRLGLGGARSRHRFQHQGLHYDFGQHGDAAIEGRVLAHDCPATKWVNG